MQDQMGFQQLKAPGFPFPEPEHLKCPRCDSTNTKFCYYNNYNMSQPRHFCKNCRRYWTKGGNLRNIPVGGGTRKSTKRSTDNNNNNGPKRHPNSTPDPTRSEKIPKPSLSSTTSSTIPQQVVSNSGVQNSANPNRINVLSVMEPGGSFSSLLASSGLFGNFPEGLNPTASGLKTVQMGDFEGNLESDSGKDQDSGRDPGFRGNTTNSINNKNNGEHSCWAGSSNGWTDLAIYTPGSSFFQ